MEDIQLDHRLIEFEKLKDEQTSRIKFRDGLFYFTMLIVGGALTLACNRQLVQTEDVLLAVPFAVFVAGVAQITCDRRVDDIGIYIRDVLAVSIAKEQQLTVEDVFQWEQFLRVAPLRRVRGIFRSVASLMLYVGSGCITLLFYSLWKSDLAANNNSEAVNNAADGVSRSTWEGLAFWAGSYLMVLLFSLFILFSLVKWNRHAVVRKHIQFWYWLRFVMCSVIFVAVWLTVDNFVPSTLLECVAEKALYVFTVIAQPVRLLATFVSLLVSAASYLLLRRLIH